jgi:hypothetical protein
MNELLNNNKNAEKWDLELSTVFMDEALELSKSRDYDFIGELARDLEQYHHLFSYLKNKFPELTNTYNKIKSNCEANCFFNGKKQNITPSLAIMNLKSNHNWTDRVDTTSKGNELKGEKVSISFKKKK